MKTEEQAALFQFKWSNIQIRVWEVIATYVNKLIQNSSATQTLIFAFFSWFLSALGSARALLILTQILYFSVALWFLSARGLPGRF